jgi:hypothetical protein
MSHSYKDLIVWQKARALAGNIAIAVDLGYLDTPQSIVIESKTAEVNRLLNGLIDSLRARREPNADAVRSTLETRNLKP